MQLKLYEGSSKGLTDKTHKDIHMFMHASRAQRGLWSRELVCLLHTLTNHWHTLKSTSLLFPPTTTYVPLDIACIVQTFLTHASSSDSDHTRERRTSRTPLRRSEVSGLSDRTDSSHFSVLQHHFFVPGNAQAVSARPALPDTSLEFMSSILCSIVRDGTALVKMSETFTDVWTFLILISPPVTQSCTHWNNAARCVKVLKH